MKTLVLTEREAHSLYKFLGKTKMGTGKGKDFDLYVIYEKLIDLGVE